jgi:hypothetical protein
VSASCCYMSELKHNFFTSKATKYSLYTIKSHYMFRPRGPSSGEHYIRYHNICRSLPESIQLKTLKSLKTLNSTKTIGHLVISTKLLYLCAVFYEVDNHCVSVCVARSACGEWSLYTLNINSLSQNVKTISKNYDLITLYKYLIYTHTHRYRSANSDLKSCQNIGRVNPCRWREHTWINISQPRSILFINYYQLGLQQA